MCHGKLNGPSTAAAYEAFDDARFGTAGMIDNFSLALSHGLILLAVWRLFARPDLDTDDPPPPDAPKPKGRAGA